MSTLSWYAYQQHMKLSTILKEKNKFCQDISISYCLKRQEILNLLDISSIDKTEADSLIVENESLESVDDAPMLIGLQDMKLLLFQKFL